MIGHGQLRFVPQLRHTLRIGEQYAACRREGYILAGTVEKTVAVLLFQLPDLRAYSGLRAKHFLPGTREAAQFGNFQKRNELIEVHRLNRD